LLWAALGCSGLLWAALCCSMLLWAVSGRALALVRGGVAKELADINSNKNAVEMKGTLKNC